MISKRKLLVAAAVLGFGVGAAVSAPADAMGWVWHKPKPTPVPQMPVKAPEIDAAAGVQAIAVLSGVLLLLGERARRRRK